MREAQTLLTSNLPAAGQPLQYVLMSVGLWVKEAYENCPAFRDSCLNIAIQSGDCL